jgi:hypothetical protein
MDNHSVGAIAGQIEVESTTVKNLLTACTGAN